MKVDLTHPELEAPVDLTSLTGIRVHGDEGVTPVDSGTASIVHAGGETWLRWTHHQVVRAVNLRHIIEVFSDAEQLTP